MPQQRRCGSNEADAALEIGSDGMSQNPWIASPPVVLVMFISHGHGFSSPMSWHVLGKPKTVQEPGLLAFGISAV